MFRCEQDGSHPPFGCGLDFVGIGDDLAAQLTTSLAVI
jgi:hypothetical protein